MRRSFLATIRILLVLTGSSFVLAPLIPGQRAPGYPLLSAATDYGKAPTAGPVKGWLVIHGGGGVSPEIKERFVALAGGADVNFVVIPTAQPDTEIDLDKIRQSFSNGFRVKNVTVLHTRDRALANSAAFVAPLKNASGVWIEGGRQWRLTDAYLGTAVEREIKALLARGGVVGGSSAGATIQGSFLVRGAPGTPGDTDGDNTIMMSPGHETGFGLLANSAIDQHVNTRGREKDLDPVMAAHPNLLGIGLDEGTAIVVHGDSFFVVGGQVSIHDGGKHDYLQSGQAFNLKTRSEDTSDELQSNEYPFVLVVTNARRSKSELGIKTVGAGQLKAADGSTQNTKNINIECNVSLYSLGVNVYPARLNGSNRIKIKTRDIDSDKVQEFTCTY